MGTLTYEERLTRRAQMEQMRAQGMSLADIGRTLEPPVSRQWVSRLLAKPVRPHGRPRRDA